MASKDKERHVGVAILTSKMGEKMTETSERILENTQTWKRGLDLPNYYNPLFSALGTFE